MSQEHTYVLVKLLTFDCNIISSADCNTDTIMEYWKVITCERNINMYEVVYLPLSEMQLPVGNIDSTYINNAEM